MLNAYMYISNDGDSSKKKVFTQHKQKTLVLCNVASTPIGVSIKIKASGA